jgi:hypothetical protein
LALAQSLFDRFFSAIDPLPLGLLVASVGGLFHFRECLAGTRAPPMTLCRSSHLQSLFAGHDRTLRSVAGLAMPCFAL